MIQFVTAAFGLAAGLAWNTAIQALIERFVGPAGDGLAGKLIYATILTVIAVTATMAISKSYERVVRKEAAAAEKRHHDKYHVVEEVEQKKTVKRKKK